MKKQVGDVTAEGLVVLKTNEQKKGSPIRAHTPGPWHVKDENAGVLIQIHSPFKTTNDSSGVPICTLVADSREGVNPFANAALIAAAPEMLRALETAKEACRDFPHAWQTVNAAIAKAKGE